MKKTIVIKPGMWVMRSGWRDPVKVVGGIESEHGETFFKSRTINRGEKSFSETSTFTRPFMGQRLFEVPPPYASICN